MTPGAMAAELVHHLQAVGAFLANLKDQAAFTEASALQRSAIEAKLPGCQLGVEDAAAVIEAVKAVPFAPADMHAVMRAISCAASSSKGDFRRASLQDYTKCVHYGTAAFWAGEQSMEALATLLVGARASQPPRSPPCS